MTEPSNVEPNNLDPLPSDERAEIAAAGHRGDAAAARDGLTSSDPHVRATAMRALRRCAALTDADLLHALDDDSAIVARAAAELAAERPDVALDGALDHADWSVVEMAAWAVGEQSERAAPAGTTIDRLIELATAHREPLVREAAIAALGAIGDPRGVPAIMAGTTDKPAIRRRAVIALAPFEGVEVDAAMARARTDRDWQVRDAAEELG